MEAGCTTTRQGCIMGALEAPAPRVTEGTQKKGGGNEEKRGKGNKEKVGKKVKMKEKIKGHKKKKR